MPPNFGNLILFGSGETAASGRRILRKFLSSLPQRQNVAILETPAGFQPNSRLVAQEIADVFNNSLSEFVSNVAIITARNKNTYKYSPNNPTILKPLKKSSFVFLGPGSPTYTVKQLQGTLIWKIILAAWKDGVTLCLSSAGSQAIGKYTLPVYEIYKVGSNLYWEDGLNLLKYKSFEVTIITHWNNSSGGKKLDTRRCFMGVQRFKKLQQLLPKSTTILGIDEHTAIIFDFSKNIFNIEGIGKVFLLRDSKEIVFLPKKTYNLYNYFFPL